MSVYLDASGDFGFLEAADGHEVYFHRNSVLDGAFSLLAVGTHVAFAEEMGDKGPQASTVKLLGAPPTVMSPHDAMSERIASWVKIGKIQTETLQKSVTLYVRLML